MFDFSQNPDFSRSRPRMRIAYATCPHRAGICARFLFDGVSIKTHGEVSLRRGNNAIRSPPYSFNLSSIFLSSTNQSDSL